MLPRDEKEKDFDHYFPFIGRGTIEHDTVSYAKMEKELKHAFSRTFMEWLRDLLGW